MSLLARLFALVLIAALPSVGLVAWDHFEQRREAEDGLRASARHYAQVGVDEIRDVIDDARQTLGLLARLPGTRAPDVAACERLAEALRATHPHFVEVGYVDAGGELVCSAGPLDATRALVDRPLFARLVAERRFAVGGYSDGNFAGEAVLPAAHPIRDDEDRMTGAIVVGIGLRWLGGEMMRMLPVEAAFSLTDRDGNTLLRSPGPDGGSVRLGGVPSDPGRLERVGRDGIRRLGAIETLSLGNGGELRLWIGLPREAALGSPDPTARRAAALAGLCLLLSVAAATLAGRLLIQQPIATLLDATRRWREGDASARAGLSGRSEFARLGHAFDDMAAAIETRRAALATSEARLRLAIEATGAGTWDLDPRTGARDWSPRLKELLGLSAEAMPSAEAFLDATHPQDRPRMDDAYARAFEPGGGRYAIEFRTRKGRWLAARGRVVFGADGKPERSVGTLLDITDAKRVEAALFEKSPVALFLIAVQPDGRFIYDEVNPVFCRYTGVKREAIVGRSPEEVFDETVSSIVNQHYGTCVSTGRGYEYEISGELPAGFLVRRTVLEPIEWDENGRVRRVLAAAMDLTEARRLEAALRQSQKIEALGQLTGGVAHDFNNLLTAVLGNLSLLIRTLPAGNERRLAESAQRAAERGARLTQQLLAFARRQQMTLQPIDLNALVNGLLDLLARTLGEVIIVETELAPELWAAVADANQVELIVLNLAINARDAMPQGGPLKISTANLAKGDPRLPLELDGDYVMVAVADRGTGMTEAVRARAFEPFFTTKEVGRGSGLGLSMVYGVASQSGGGATIESTVGRGTTVRVFFKRAAEG